MCVLNIEYLSYLCQFSLTVNNPLVNLYHQYSYEYNNDESSLDYNYSDYQHNEFLIHLIDSAECWSSAEMAKSLDDMVISYDRLSDLIHYMHHINYLMKRHKTFLEESLLYYPKLGDCQLEDSRLEDLQIDNKRHLCKIKLKNVLLYGEKRTNKRIPVNCGSLCMTFYNTKEIEMKGEIFVENHEVNIVKKWHIMETKEKHICFCLMILIGCRCFLLQITCSDIELEISI